MLRNNLRNLLYFKNIRKISSVKEDKCDSFPDKPDPNLIKNDYIGPPDKESNLRPYIRSISKNESYLANKLRMKQTEVEEWNQSFWSRHNKRFYEEKQEFIKLHNQSGIYDISADRMSQFYKTFLDKNQKVSVQNVYKSLRFKKSN